MVGPKPAVAPVSEAADAREDHHHASGTRSVARGGFANLVGAGYAGIASFVITALVARMATTQDAGIYFSSISILLIAVALVELGTPVGFVYFLARLRGLEQTGRMRAILTAGAVPMIAIGSVVAVVGILAREPLGELLLGPEVDPSATIMVVLALTLLVAITADSVLGATRGLGVMRPTVVTDRFVNPTVQLAALLLLAAAGWTASEELILTRTAGFLAVVVLALPWLLRLLRRYPAPAGTTFRETWIPDAELLGRFWRFTGPRALGQFAQVGIQRVDIVLVALWLSPAEAAVYAVATRFLVFGQLAANAIGTAVQPRISTLAARGERAALQHLYRTSTAWVMFATWPIYLVFIVHAERLMRLFGEEYASGALVLQVLSAAMLVATACGAVDAVLLMAGKSTWTMMNAWGALVLNVALNIWLIPLLGILGAAIAWAGAIVANNLVPLLQVRLGLGVHPFGRTTLSAALIPVVLFGGIPWMVDAMGGGPLGALISATFAVAIYSALVWKWRHSLGVDGLLSRRARNRPSTP